MTKRIEPDIFARLRDPEKLARLDVPDCLEKLARAARIIGDYDCAALLYLVDHFVCYRFQDGRWLHVYRDAGGNDMLLPVDWPAMRARDLVSIRLFVQQGDFRIDLVVDLSANVPRGTCPAKT